MHQTPKDGNAGAGNPDTKEEEKNRRTNNGTADLSNSPKDSLNAGNQGRKQGRQSVGIREAKLPSKKNYQKSEMQKNLHNPTNDP